MATPTFNDAETNSLNKLKFENGGMDTDLSGSGNTVVVQVSEPEYKELSASPVGQGWTMRRTIAARSRRVVWECQLKAVSAVAMNRVEAQIELYLSDGRAYALTDGWGRTAAKAVLRREGTERIGPRRITTGSAYIQRWRLTFDVLAPTSGSATAL